MAVKQSDKIRYAVVGLGHIAQNAVLPGFTQSTANSELVALVSGDEIKLQKLSKEYNVDYTFDYSDYRKMLYSGLIDAVYISLPNDMHARFAVEAMQAGVHVLCEKPLAMSVDDAKVMAQVSEKTGSRLMTAYRLHFQRANLKAIEIAKSGQLGDVRFFNSVFSMRVKEGNVRTSRTKGGGPLYDIGIYCINAVRGFFGELPEEIFAFANQGFDQRSKEVDEMLSVVMKFSGGRMATFICSFNGNHQAAFDVVGTTGCLRLENAYEYFDDMTLHFSRVNAAPRKYKFKKSDQFGPEIVYFSDCLINKKHPEPNATEGVLDLMVIEAIMKSVKLRKPVTLTALSKTLHPTLRQALRRPAVEKPFTIHVEAPSMD